MSVFTILNLFLLPALIVILILGVILNYKYVEKNVYQKYLIATLLFWAAIMIFVYIKFFADGTPTISYVRDVCGMQVLLLGICCFFSLVSYPVVILNARFLTFKRWFRAARPTNIALAVYFGYHLFTHTDPFVKYPSFREFFAEIGSLSVILRLSVVVAYAYTAVDYMRAIWRVVPFYNKYVQDNIADSECNVGWIRPMVKYISLVMCSYALLLFFSSPIVNALYLISLICLFFYIVEVSLLHRTSENIERLAIFADEKKPNGYIFVDLGIGVVTPEELKTEEHTLDVTLRHINIWMKSEAPYTNVDFTTSEILAAFPSLTHQDLTTLFRSRGESFQSYVRRFRIVKACELIDNEGGQSYPKQTFAMVGFSHHSSFSRSFVAVIGVSPSEYTKLSKEQKQSIIAQVIDNQQNTPPSR